MNSSSPGLVFCVDDIFFTICYLVLYCCIYLLYTLQVVTISYYNTPIIIIYHVLM